MTGVHEKTIKYRLDCIDSIQERFETLRDLRSYNMTKTYSEELNKKIKAVEKHAIFSEFANAAFVWCSAQMILKLGIGTVAVVGSSLLIKGEINVLTFFMFLLVVTRMYEPLQISLQNIAAIISIDVTCTLWWICRKMPEKWNSMIGENGSELSGGERQHILIARAFLKNAPIILMDEATASLDVDNKSLIQESISKLIKDKTVLIIAYRMRTVDGVDKIVVLKDGKVAESGSPEELKKLNGIYKHMSDIQISSSQWKY